LIELDSCCQGKFPFTLVAAQLPVFEGEKGEGQGFGELIHLPMKTDTASGNEDCILCLQAQREHRKWRKCGTIFSVHLVTT